MDPNILNNTIIIKIWWPDIRRNDTGTHDI